MTKTINKVNKGSITRRKNKVKKNVYAYFAGIILGGVIPLIAFNVAHVQVIENPALWVIVAGALIYSAPMVSEWFGRYVGKVKGWGFTVALEVSLTFTHHWTAWLALVVLVGLNAFVLANRFTQD
jgi:hypothetical protein